MSFGMGYFLALSKTSPDPLPGLELATSESAVQHVSQDPFLMLITLMNFVL